jgi:hypothetical protein
LALTENFKELLKQRGATTFLVRLWDALPKKWRDEWRWERLRQLWWLWSVFGLSGGVALALWLTPLTVGPSTTAATVAGAGQIVQVSPHPQIKAGIDLNQYSRKTCFDYSTNTGVVTVSLNSIIFEIHFSKRSTDSIYVYKDSTNLRAIADLKGVTPGEGVNFAAFDSSSRFYTVPLGGFFIAQNNRLDLIDEAAADRTEATSKETQGVWVDRAGLFQHSKPA